MPLDLRLRQQAITDLDDIWDYTCTTHGAAQAVSYLNELDATFHLLTEHPEMARIREEFDPPVRLHPHREHLVIYRIEEAHLEVLRILHRRANWSEFLSE